jgi:hypothetical protein
MDYRIFNVLSPDRFVRPQVLREGDLRCVLQAALSVTTIYETAVDVSSPPSSKVHFRVDNHRQTDLMLLYMYADATECIYIYI